MSCTTPVMLVGGRFPAVSGLRLLRQIKKKLARLEPDVFPEDAQDMMQMEAIQQKLPFKAE